MIVGDDALSSRENSFLLVIIYVMQRWRVERTSTLTGYVYILLSINYLYSRILKSSTRYE